MLHFKNPRADRAAPYAADATLSAAGFAAARAEIASWPGYAPTPLLALPGLAARLGLARLWWKDEGRRFVTGSFKALGGPYAVGRVVQAAVERATGRRPTMAALAAGEHADIAHTVTVTCATDGNHGRAVAWGATMFGARAVIFVAEGVSEGRAAAIAAYGATVERVPGSYDDAVRHAASTAAARGWTVVSDTSYEGYTDIPRDVMYGYGLMADEAMAQLATGQAGVLPTHVLVHAGVGAWAAAMCARFWQEWGAARPRFVVVEPDRADALYKSAVAGHPVVVPGPHDTVMGGLACGEISLLGWEILATGADDFVVIPDERAIEAMRALATPAAGDPPVVAGETGAASLGALLAARADPALAAALGLDATARVLLFGSEGATDPAIYRQLVGRSAEEVAGADGTGKPRNT